MKSLKPTQHAAVLLGAILLAYAWLQVPTMQAYSLQVFALLVAGFLLFKKLRGGKFWHVLPAHTSAEMSILTFAFLLLIGATGNLESPFFPLAFLHIFFVVMTAHPITAIISTTGLMLFHYALETSPGLPTVQAFLTMIIMMGIFIFAKKQYDSNKRQTAKLAVEEKELELLSDQEHTLEQFIETFLTPRIARLKELSEHPEDNLSTITTQLDLIQDELRKLSNSVIVKSSSKPEQNGSSNEIKHE